MADVICEQPLSKNEINQGILRVNQGKYVLNKGKSRNIVLNQGILS